MKDPYEQYAAKARSIVECRSGERNALARGREDVAAAYRRREEELKQQAPSTVSRREWLLSLPTATGPTPEQDWHPVLVNIFGYPVHIMFRLGRATEALANFQELLPHLHSDRADSIRARLESYCAPDAADAEVCIAIDNDALNHLRSSDQKRIRVSLAVVQGLCLLACLYGIGGSVLAQLNQGPIRSRHAPDTRRFFELYFGEVVDNFDEYRDDRDRYVYRGVTIALEEWNSLFTIDSTGCAGALTERVHALREQRAAREARASERRRRHRESMEIKKRMRLEEINRQRNNEEARITSLKRLAANDFARVSALVRSLYYQVRHELRFLGDEDRGAVSIEFHETDPSATTYVSIGHSRRLTIVSFQQLQSCVLVTSGLKVSESEALGESHDFTELEDAVQYVLDFIARELARI